MLFNQRSPALSVPVANRGDKQTEIATYRLNWYRGRVLSDSAIESFAPNLFKELRYDQMKMFAKPLSSRTILSKMWSENIDEIIQHSIFRFNLEQQILRFLQFIGGKKVAINFREQFLLS